MGKTTAYERGRNKKLNKIGYRFPDISVSGRNEEVSNAVAFWKEGRQNVSDKVCQAVMMLFEKEQKESANNNMQFYMEEHERRLLTLPRIDGYAKYLKDGNPSVTKLHHSKAIHDEDLIAIHAGADKILREIEADKEANLLIKKMILEGLTNVSR